MTIVESKYITQGVLMDNMQFFIPSTLLISRLINQKKKYKKYFNKSNYKNDNHDDNKNRTYSLSPSSLS